MADKLFPRWLQALAETSGSQIETLNRAERLGVLTSTYNRIRLDAIMRMGFSNAVLPAELPLLLFSE
jgi:hypothetical protein